MIRAAIYARISYDPDVRAVGVDRQREDCLRLAASRGWTVVAEYIDNNVSASKYSRKARTQYLRLLDDATSRQRWPRRRLKGSAGVSCASGFKQRRTASLMEADGGGSGSLVLARTGSPQSRSSKSAG